MGDKLTCLDVAQPMQLRLEPKWTPPACLQEVSCEEAKGAVPGVAPLLSPLPLGGRLLVASHSLHVEGLLHLHLGSILSGILHPPMDFVGRGLPAGGDRLNLRSIALTIQREPVEVGLLLRHVEVQDVFGHNIFAVFLPRHQLDWPFPFADIPSVPLRCSGGLQDVGVVGAAVANRWHHEAGLELLGVILAHPLEADIEVGSPHTLPVLLLQALGASKAERQQGGGVLWHGGFRLGGCAIPAHPHKIAPVATAGCCHQPYQLLEEARGVLELLAGRLRRAKRPSLHLARLGLLLPTYPLL